MTFEELFPDDPVGRRAGALRVRRRTLAGGTSLSLANVIQRRGRRAIGEPGLGPVGTPAAHAGMVFAETATEVAAAQRASSDTGTRTNSMPVAQ
jgi:hypothetical protein